MPTVIDKFDGEYRFLSNFYWFKTSMHGVPLQTTVEHMYQASKCASIADAFRIIRLGSPGEAKKAGRTVKLRPDWELVKLTVMDQWVWAKFSSSPELADKLIATDLALLVEGNTWGDRYWGMVPDAKGEGENHLGKILMRVRARLRKERRNG